MIISPVRLAPSAPAAKPSDSAAMNAADTAAALAQRAEAVCRQFLPQGKRQGRYWCAGDVRGASGRSLFVRLEPPGRVGKWQDANSGEYGDLLDLVRLATGARSLREALAEARRFLAQPAPPGSTRRDTYDRTAAARNLWDRCGPMDSTHAEAYLKARGIHRCRFAALRFHPCLPFKSDAGAWRRFPALVAAVTGDDGALEGVHRSWLDPRQPRLARVSRPRKALGRIHGLAVRFGEPHTATTLLVGEGIETVLSLVTAWPDTMLPDAVLPHAAVPHAVAAAALSAGSLGAFVPPKHVTRLIVAQDRDEAGARASRRLQLRCTRLGVATAVLVPDRNDFNDDLRAFGANPLARRLAPLAARAATGNRSSLAART